MHLNQFTGFLLPSFPHSLIPSAFFLGDSDKLTKCLNLKAFFIQYSVKLIKIRKSFNGLCDNITFFFGYVYVPYIRQGVHSDFTQALKKYAGNRVFTGWYFPV